MPTRLAAMIIRKKAQWAACRRPRLSRKKCEEKLKRAMAKAAPRVTRRSRVGLASPRRVWLPFVPRVTPRVADMWAQAAMRKTDRWFRELMRQAHMGAWATRRAQKGRLITCMEAMPGFPRAAQAPDNNERVLSEDCSLDEKEEADAAWADLCTIFS